MFAFLDFLRLYTALKSLKLDKKLAFSLGKRGKPSQKAHFFNTSNKNTFRNILFIQQNTTPLENLKIGNPA